MSASNTPILDLELPPPTRRNEISFKGLLKAIPAALAVVAIVPASVFVRVMAEKYLPYRTDLIFHSLSLGRVFDPLSRMQLVPALLSLWTGMWIATALHELGHALAASLGDWRLVEIRAVPLTLRNLGGKWRLSICWKVWPAAAVFADPKPIRFHSKLRAYALAGPVANLLMFTLGILILPSLHASPAAAVLRVAASWCIFGAIFNLLPLHIGSMELDGYVALVVSNRPKLIAARIASIKIRNHVLGGKSLEHVNPRWIALAEGVAKATLQSLTGLWLAYSYWLAKDQYDRAAQVLERVLQVSGAFNEEAKGILYSECAVIQSFRKRKPSVQTWEDRAKMLSQPEYIQHRRRSCLAYNDDDFDRAAREAELTKAAAMKLQDKAAREVFLRSWSLWIKEIAEKRAATKGSTLKCQSHTASL